jgi:hypothetical protein
VVDRKEYAARAGNQSASRVASSVRGLGGRGEIRRLLSLIVYRQGLSAIGYRDRHLKKKAGCRGCDLLFVLRTRSRGFGLAIHCVPDFIYLSQNFPSTLPPPQLTRSKPEVVPIFTHQQTNIHLDTRPFATMPPRRRRASNASTISSGDGDGLETREYRDENEVLKAVAKDANEETFPVYLLEEVTVYSMDSKTVESLLEVTIKGKLLVRGRLVIPKDEPEIHHCKSTQHRVC